jgi:nucleotide-binding universal stress UspA family protein
MNCKHILVPLDLIRGSADALVCVQNLAAASPVRVTLLHVIELNIVAPTELYDQLRAESAAALRKLARLFFGSEQAVQISVCNGRPAEQIIAQAQTAMPDLIVMSGPKRRRGPRFWKRGTTQQVVNSAPCPTLVLPHRKQAGTGTPLRAENAGAGAEICLFSAGEQAAAA